MNEKQRGTKTSWTDPDDAPELTNDWFARADLYDGDRLLRKGGRPRKAAPKEAINIRLDADLLAYYRATGRGWQSRINTALRKAVKL